MKAWARSDLLLTRVCSHCERFSSKNLCPSDHVEGKRRRDRCRLDQLGGRPQLGRTTGSPFMNPAQPARHGHPGASPVEDLCDARLMGSPEFDTCLVRVANPELPPWIPVRRARRPTQRDDTAPGPPSRERLEAAGFVTPLHALEPERLPPLGTDVEQGEHFTKIAVHGRTLEGGDGPSPVARSLTAQRHRLPGNFLRWLRRRSGRMGSDDVGGGLDASRVLRITEIPHCRSPKPRSS